MSWDYRHLYMGLDYMLYHTHKHTPTQNTPKCQWDFIPIMDRRRKRT